ncbi:hypothetical protein [Natronorubrum texcoconense]|uniref:Uncharacterized protein n=1 Tax=Natronorubrum texcoconense TaxID=1095776 RepID=A0A1G9E2T4_9EURY|nr:hypothetical protein [Natronorubrum texcoconense]SDK70431.1 hypothetical protein SAMN04515672_3735 [Natronorubrum texcoconense]
MVSERTPVGFSVYQLLTRVIPGLIFVSVTSYILAIGQVADRDDGFYWLTSATDEIFSTAIELHLWVPIVVGSILAGEIINLTRKTVIPVPSEFRRYMFRSENSEAASVLSFWQYLSNSFKKTSEKTLTDRSRSFFTNVQVIYFAITLYTSLIFWFYTNDPLRAFNLFVFSEAIGWYVLFFRKEIWNELSLENHPIYLYLVTHSTTFFDTSQADDILINVRKDCGFDSNMNDPVDLYSGLHMILNDFSNPTTNDLRLFYHLNKNLLISMAFVTIILLIFVISGTIEQQLVSVLLFFLAYIPYYLYTVVVSFMDVERKYIRMLLMEYHIMRSE